MDTKIKEIRELKRMQEELAAELDALVDEVKRYMDAEGVDTISGTDWKGTYKAVTSARFDSTAFKKAMPDLAEAFTKNGLDVIALGAGEEGAIERNDIRDGREKNRRVEIWLK